MKTIKRERQVRFDELIKYVWDKRIVEMNFKSKKGVSVYVHSDGDIDVNEVRYISKDDLFTITEEVEIDYDTILDLIAVRKVGTVSRFENRSIQGVLVHFEGEVDYIYFQNPDGSIGDLIWSKERGLID
ncbi:hypothetical protein CW677_08740 [Macrococcoides caseolyticum]|uniref:hypothetical protein n=1 Tax=Macrococcoides caseolyticum TaxID=69966 RepID=UPI000C3239BA|nr:hypothetical protein [Macrococcus caseolyticus]PKE47254.1 hypothetical protein CW677_08740 [Macrococcus caseolyticus]